MVYQTLFSHLSKKEEKWSGYMRLIDSLFVNKMLSLLLDLPKSNKLYACIYSTAHVQVYKKTQVMIHASRNFAFNSRVGLVRHERILLANDN